MDKETYEALVEGEALYLLSDEVPSLERASTNNELYHLVSYEWACGVVSSLGWDGLRIMDVACGSGYGAWRLAQLPSVESVRGIDLNPRQLAHARHKYQGPKITFDLGDATALSSLVPAGSVDVTVSFQTIEHLLDPVGFLAGVHHSMTDEGLLLLASPTHQRPVFLSEKNPYHVLEYDPDLLEHLLQFFFERIRFFDDMPSNESFEYLKMRMRGNIVIPRANFVTVSKPKSELQPADVQRFRLDFMSRLWQMGMKTLQEKAIKDRKAKHFLTQCYTFVDFEEGFYQPELTGIWTKTAATLAFDVSATSARCGFTMVPAYPDISVAEPLSIRVIGPDGSEARHELVKRQSLALAFDCARGRNLVRLGTNRTWVPAENSDSTDIRRLALKLSSFWMCEDEG